MPKASKRARGLTAASTAPAQPADDAATATAAAASLPRFGGRFLAVEVSLPSVPILDPAAVVDSAGIPSKFHPTTAHFTAAAVDPPPSVQLLPLSQYLLIRPASAVPAATATVTPDQASTDPAADRCCLHVSNLPLGASPAHLRRLFRRCGDVVRVSFVTASGTPLRDGAPHGHHAVVEFDEPAAVERAMLMRARRRVWSDRIDNAAADDGAAPDTGEAALLEGAEPLGIDKWIKEYQGLHPSLTALRKEADDAIHTYAQMEEAHEAARAARHTEPDADGFVVVARKHAGSGLPRAPGSGPGKGQSASARRRTKKAHELVDFYRFQMRENKRNDLAILRARFEEDKKKIALLKT
ncbi:Ribosomal RNA-processing protein 7 A, partial [Cladochytrium tenue]